MQPDAIPPAVVIEPLPLGIFPVLLLGLACVMFIMAAFGRNGIDGEVYRQRLLSAGLACWVLYILLQLIGGLVK